MKEISIDSVVQRKDDHLIVSELGDEIVMMDIENGSYISLNKTGRIIWEQIERPVEVGIIIRNLMEMFPVEEKTCTYETLDFLNKIAEQKALRII